MRVTWAPWLSLAGRSPARPRSGARVAPSSIRAVLVLRSFSLPFLGPDSRAWLGDALELARPGHHWLERLSDEAGS